MNMTPQKRIAMPPSEDEISRLLSFAHSSSNTHDLRDVVRIIATTGMRAVELCNLRWSDVDLEGRFITISQHKNMRDRRIPFSARTAGIFRARRKQQPMSDHVLGIAPRRVLDRVSHQLRTFSAQLGRHSITLHGLRLAFANRWVNSGGCIPSLASILGHSSCFTTIRLISPTDSFRTTARNLAQIESRSK